LKRIDGLKRIDAKKEAKNFSLQSETVIFACETKWTQEKNTETKQTKRKNQVLHHRDPKAKRPSN
jgi:hypothetical protein